MIVRTAIVALIFSAATGLACAASMPSAAAEREANNLMQCSAMFPNNSDCISFVFKYHRLPRSDEMGLAAKASREQSKRFWQQVNTMAKHEETCEDAGACLTVTIQPQ